MSNHKYRTGLGSESTNSNQFNSVLPQGSALINWITDLPSSPLDSIRSMSVTYISARDSPSGRQKIITLSVLRSESISQFPVFQVPSSLKTKSGPRVKTTTEFILEEIKSAAFIKWHLTIYYP